MALSDLELIQLAEQAKEKTKGPKGDPGVSVEKIEQFDDDSFTIFLTNGYSKKIQLSPGKDGGVGPQGIQGERGEPGPSGRNGRDGSQGSPGNDGQDGVPGLSIETAVVNANGHLLLGLSDGTPIDVGRVVGPAGTTGDRGPTGLVGSDGRDGAAVLSGPRAPTQDDGKEGDHWIDISSAEFSFFKKNGEGWTKLANLRQPARDPRVGPVAGGGGSGTGGGGNGVDLPPVIIDKNPPAKGNNKKPVREGDLWFDSDQLSLYVATKDSINNIVWVVCIPGVTGVPGTQAASIPVIWPAAVDGEEWLNPLTQVTYKYNAPKKQWINVNGGIVNVQDKPPLTPQTGSLWFDTEDDELTLYLYNGSTWVPAAPPVSLDGINATINAALLVQDDLKARVQVIESSARNPTAKYDGIYEFIDGLSTTGVSSGQVIFTDIIGVRVTDPESVANILLCEKDFNWDAFMYNGTIKVVNSDGVLAGYYLALDCVEVPGRNMTIIVKYLYRGSSGGSLTPTQNSTLSFRNCFYS